jgi:hypothetical protein
VFFTDKTFQPNILFERKAGPSQGEHLKEAPFRASFWPYPQTLDLAGKACQGQTLYLITNIHKLRTKKVL